MPFVVAGHPAPASLGTLLRTLEAAGADAVEVGIPFSDPIADGPVIAAAMHRSLSSGVTVEAVLQQMRAARPTVDIPVLAMASVSIVDRLGGPSFLDTLHESGFDGLILPDADLDAVGPMSERAERLDMAFTSLIAPDTPMPRVERIASHAREFIYILARRGLTGARKDAPEIATRVAELRQVTNLPLVAGFGISTTEHVQAVLSHAQGAIVGSALVAALDAQTDDPSIQEVVERLLVPMAAAISGTAPR